MMKIPIIPTPSAEHAALFPHRRQNMPYYSHTVDRTCRIIPTPSTEHSALFPHRRQNMPHYSHTVDRTCRIIPTPSTKHAALFPHLWQNYMNTKHFRRNGFILNSKQHWMRSLIEMQNYVEYVMEFNTFGNNRTHILWSVTSNRWNSMHWVTT